MAKTCAMHAYIFVLVVVSKRPTQSTPIPKFAFDSELLLY